MTEHGIAFPTFRMKPQRLEMGETQGLFLCSDLHIGSSAVDYKLLKKEFQEAKGNNDRIFINGDVFDAILVKDHKRYTPDCIVKQLQGRNDLLNATLDFAEELLAPFASNIDGIGVGNHEGSITKYGNLDLVSLLIERLEKHKGASITHMGYYGVLLIPFADKKGKSNGCLDIVYHHGAGGGGEVTLGTISFNRAATWCGERSVIWMGHTHDKNTNENLVLTVSQSGQAYLKPRRYIRTGSYYDSYFQPEDDYRTGGRRAQYAADAFKAPKGKGGARLLITPNRTRNLDMKVIQ